MRKGTVKFFNESKGFGFITDNETGEEVFVHASGLVSQIKENDQVAFQTQQGKKGINAVDVKIV